MGFWNPEQDAILLECSSEEDFKKNFPGRSLASLQRRQRHLKSIVTIRKELPLTVEEESDKDRKIQRLQDEIAHIKRKYKFQTRESAGMDALVEAIYAVAPTMKPVQVPVPYEIVDDVEEESLVLLLGDLHYGQVVDEEQTGGISVYSPDIARKRFEFTIDTAIKLAKEKLDNYHFTKLHVFGLGDWVSGVIHDELLHNDEGGIVEQVLGAVDILAAGILRLCMEFPEVKFTGVVGNHGRVTQKMYWNAKAVNNYDWMVYKFLEKLLADQPNLSFNCPKSFWAVEKVENTTFLIEHGDTVRSWGSIPFYGLSRAYMKMRTLQEDYGITFQHMVVGHLHNPNIFTMVRRKMIINGAFVGGDPFSIGAVSAACDPVQMMFGVHRRKGITHFWELNSKDVK